MMASDIRYLLGTSRLLLVSNRLPFTVRVDSKGQVALSPSTGGLATGMRSLLEEGVATWAGWPGLSEEAAGDLKGSITKALQQRNVIPVWLTSKEVEGYYEGFCNSTIWPLFHYFIERASFNKDYWTWYREVNEKFADAVARSYRRGDIVWVHDYHLMLLPSMLRERLGDDVPMGFFLHIPFPSFEVFRQLPWREEVLRGLLGADLIGFHTYDYMNYFLESVRRILGIEHYLGELKYGERSIKVDVFPMGVDFNRLRAASMSEAVTRKFNELTQRLGSVKVIFSIDRLDYTKGLPERLRAFKRFLEKYPEYRSKVSYIFVVSPSRERVEEYARLKREINELVSEINGQFSTLEWTPVIYMRRFVPDDELLALYRLADVALITPLRDGMNLVAKEYVAANVNRNGVLIVSEGAGAASELVEAIVVNPNDYEGVADAIKRALEMSDYERTNRMASLEGRVSSYDVSAWSYDFLASLLNFKKVQAAEIEEAITRRLTGVQLSLVISSFIASRGRILFLDYDGTLVPMAPFFWMARPDDELLSLLSALASKPNTKVVVVTSRSRTSIESMLGGVKNIDMAAENGGWIYMDGRWVQGVSNVDTSWKQEVIKVLTAFTKRTPGSYVEEKDFSVTWHYRNVPGELGSARANELMDLLSRFIAVHPNLAVVKAPMAIEVRLAGLSKSRAAMNWLSRGNYDFIFAAGDSGDDEDLFASLPQGSVTVKVGYGPSKAKYYVPSPNELRQVLEKLAEA
jgi:trehalose 6-phosphate synthase/phosphatase